MTARHRPIAPRSRPTSGRTGAGSSCSCCSSWGRSACSWSSPLILRDFIDSAMAGAAVAGLTTAGIAYLIAGILNQLLDAGALLSGNRHRLERDQPARRGVDLSSLLPRHGVPQRHDTRGDDRKRVDGRRDRHLGVHLAFLVRLIAAGVLLTGVVIVCWFESPAMGLTITLYVVAVLAFLIRLRKVAVAAAEEERETSARLYGFIEERLAGVDDIRSLGAGRFTMTRFIPVMRDFYTRTTNAWRKRIMVWVSANTAFWAGDALALIIGVWLTVRGSITVGDRHSHPPIRPTGAASDRADDPGLQELQKRREGSSASISCAISGLRSRMVPRRPAPPDPWRSSSTTFPSATRNGADSMGSASLSPPANPSACWVGPEGARPLSHPLSSPGSTTPVEAWCGSGHDLRGLRSESLRRSVGVVTQDVQLFEATVRDNLTFFAERPTTSSPVRSGESGSRPMDREARAGTRDSGAGGQGALGRGAATPRLARVFLQDPGSGDPRRALVTLDPVTEMLLATATERLYAGRTVVIIAHRLETVRTADEIMVVDAGRIVEHGPARPWPPTQPPDTPPCWPPGGATSWEIPRP